MKTALRTIEPSFVEAREYPLNADGLPTAEIRKGEYMVRFAGTPAELDAVLRLRFEVFNLELNEGLDASYLTGRDRDEFDATCHHLIVVDTTNNETVGTYRLRTREMTTGAHGFYSAEEFNLSSMPADIRDSAVEVGRACVARAHRNTRVLFLLWQGLAAYMLFNRKRYFFGCCSLASQVPQEGLRALNQLQQQGQLHPSLFISPQKGFECVPE